MELICQNYIHNCQKIGCEPTKSILSKLNNKDSYKSKNGNSADDVLDLSSISTTLNVILLFNNFYIINQLHIKKQAINKKIILIFL